MLHSVVCQSVQEANVLKEFVRMDSSMGVLVCKPQMVKKLFEVGQNLLRAVDAERKAGLHRCKN